MSIEREKAIDEFKFIVQTYILPLFELKGTPKFIEKSEENKQLISLHSETNNEAILKIYPLYSKGTQVSNFFFTVKTYSGGAIKRRAEIILKELLRVSEYNYDSFKKKMDYSSNPSYKYQIFNLAFEIGICTWLATSNYANVLHSVVSHLNNWSSRTYEGKNVPFGIVLDFKEVVMESPVSFLNFLENDYSAVLTDGIYSGVLLDRNGNIIRFLTHNECEDEDVNRTAFVPHQYNDIAKMCTKNRVGVILLTNGEILLVKNKSICFAKRGNKWVPFDYNRILIAIKPYFERYNIIDANNKIKELYCTLLDISFSHTGGCLALTLPDIGDELDTLIKERIDVYSCKHDIPDVAKNSKEKIAVLSFILSDSNNSLKSFFDVERILRKEILEFDGAVVISLDGCFYCIGSIVQVPGGSEGGGRTAAAKNLARLGIGIKISEDGYIEAFGRDFATSQDKKNKKHILPLFKIK